ncbi:MAG: caspase family protein [Cyanobacteria bacterium P01_F01_bin.150]
MAQIPRRRFLQFAGSALASLGMGHLNIAQYGNQYGRVLAQSTPRKLALLVGINQYSSAQANWQPLRGCVNDVQMQQALLIHRFGFQPSDILTLTDQQATRQGILDAFQSHLIDQAKPGDVVVFHYSGHGSRVIDPNPYQDDNPLNSTLVPINSPLPNFGALVEQGGRVNDIMGRTLFLLMTALQTEQVTVVLDSCYAGGGKRGTVVVRSRLGANDGLRYLYPVEAELEFQSKLRTDLKINEADFSRLRRANIAKGVVIASAAENQYAIDANFDGVRAGVFTYLLTQYLWQQQHNTPFRRTFINIDRATQTLASNRFSRQNPEFEANVSPSLDNAPLYFSTMQSLPSEAVITDVNGTDITLWMGGVHPKSLPAFSKGTLFEAIAPAGTLLGLVELTNRGDALTATGKFLEPPNSPLPATVLLQEKLRIIPEDLTLYIGLDASLAEEAAIAQAPLTRIDRLVPVQGDDERADYLLVRITSQILQPQILQPQTTPLEASPETSPEIGSIGLVLPDLSLVPRSFGGPQETVLEAIVRLQPTLKRLLAARLLRIMVNPDSSQLRVTAALNVLGSDLTQTPIITEIRGTRGVIPANNSEEPEEDSCEVSDAEAASRQSDSSTSLTRNQSSGQSGQGTDPLVRCPIIPLEDSTRLPLDSIIQLEVTNQERRHPDGLYISLIAIDPDGSMTLLFPANNWAAPDSAALIDSGETLRVPDAARGDRFRIRLGRPVGVTEILVLASTIPLRSTLTALGSLAQSQPESNSVAPNNPANSRASPEPNTPVADLTHSWTEDVVRSGQPTAPFLGTNNQARQASISNQQLAAWIFSIEVYDPNQIP